MALKTVEVDVPLVVCPSCNFDEDYCGEEIELEE